ncbi:MAG: HlyC/CorC family transporter [Lachnospiraceae bacterium]|nr:HlyC/CorC family transporter [Lachnospiraceae bacterium]
MDVYTPAVIIALTVLLVINIITSLAEGAFEDLNEENFDPDKNCSPGKGALIKKYLDMTPKLSATALWIRIFTIIFLGVFVVVPLSRYFCGVFVLTPRKDILSWLVGAVIWVIISILYMTICILVPYRLADKDPDKWAKKTVYPSHFFAIILTPLTLISTKTAKWISTLFGVPADYSTEEVTEEDIISIVNEGHEQGILESSEAEMISNIFEFDDKEACDIMTHRKNITAIDISESIDNASDIMLMDRYSRYPVYEGDIDNIVGILYFKDVMRVRRKGRKNVKLSAVMREPYFVPETQSINSLFEEMQKRKTHMAIVIDEYGQTAGIVAMEDILEEIVGNILDEYDVDVRYIKDNGDGTFNAKGLTPLQDLEDILDIVFDDDEFDTLNGFLISRIEHIPEEKDHDEIEYQGYIFRIIKAGNNMIQEVSIRKILEDDADGTDK